MWQPGSNDQLPAQPPGRPHTKPERVKRHAGAAAAPTPMSRSKDEWVAFFCQQDDGTRLSEFLRQQRGDGSPFAYECKPQTLYDKLRTIDQHRLKHFLYDGTRLSAKERQLIVDYLCECGVLKVASAGLKHRDEVLPALQEDLGSFLDLQDTSDLELAASAHGRYWIYRPSVHHPTWYVRGMLTIPKPAARNAPLRVREEYFIKGNAAKGVREFREHYEGIMLRTKGYPFMLSYLRPADREARDANSPVRMESLSVFRVVMIARMQTDDGMIVSMTGLTSAIYSTGGFLASVMCFERVPADMEADAESKMDIIEEKELPDAVRERLKTLNLIDGLIKL